VLVEGRRSHSCQMPDRFQKEIDARAMREGLVGSDEYLQHWQWSEKLERDLPPEDLLATVVRELELKHSGGQ
jgi:hypothetical protein